MSSAQLLTTQQLAARPSEPDLLVLNCRFALEDPSYGAHVYQENHTPGAHSADLKRDSSAPVRRGMAGRHPLPDPTELALKLQTWDLRQGNQVVLCNDGPGASAARVWRLLHWLGKHGGVHLLDGDLAAWKAAELTLTNDESSLRPGDFQGQPDASLLVDATTLQAQLGQPGLALFDAHAQPHFRGEVKPIGPVAGHTPDAQCATFTDNFGSDGRFLPPEQLHRRFSALLHGRPVDELVTYCGSSVTAYHNLFALSLASFPLPHLYTGSWSEQITGPRRPVTTSS